MFIWFDLKISYIYIIWFKTIRFIYKLGSASCTDCPPGTFFPPHHFSGECQLCEPGTYSREPRATECKKCAGNAYYQPRAGQTGCLRCPSDHVASGYLSGTLRYLECFKCEAGSFEYPNGNENEYNVTIQCLYIDNFKSKIKKNSDFFN